MSTETWTRKRITATIAITVLVTLAATQSYLILAGPGRSSASGAATGSGGNSTLNTITVTGTGTVQVPPDRAILSIAVVIQASTAQTAVQQAADAMNHVVSGLNNIGVDNSNIQTTYYNIYAQSSCCNGTPTITGYQVTDQIQVTVTSSAQTAAELGARTGLVIDTAVTNGANQINGITFTVAGSALQAAQQTALQDAAKDASTQAHLIASALNVSVTGVISVTTSPGYTPPIYTTPPRTLSGSGTIISAPQSLTITATVQAVFSIA